MVNRRLVRFLADNQFDQRRVRCGSPHPDTNQGAVCESSRGPLQRIARQLALLMIEGYSVEGSEHIKGYWKAGCALSLSYTGLGAIGWFEKARDRLKLSGYDLCK